MIAHMKDTPEILLLHGLLWSVEYSFAMALNKFYQSQSNEAARCCSFHGKQHQAPLFSLLCSTEFENLQSRLIEDTL